MSDNRFEQVRKSRGVPVKRNAIVTYQGVPFRVAAINGGGLVLRNQIMVHPTDPGLVYEHRDGIKAIRQHIRECEKRIAERDAGERPQEFAFEQTEERAFLAGLKRALEHMGVKP